ncbi:MAG: PDZ domain-containing protein [Planctomycetota bacterium]
MIRTKLAIAAVVTILLSTPVALCEDPGTRELVRRLLAAEGKEMGELLKRVLAAKPDPEDLASWLEEAPAYRPDAPTGRVKREAKGLDGKTRPWILHVPLDYTPERRYPLVLDLHDHVEHRRQPPEDTDALEEIWGDVAESRQWLLAIPTGQRGAEWWTTTGAAGVVALVKEVKRTWNVDDDRVFVTGRGDGGSGCYALALVRSTPFAGFAAVGGHPEIARFGGEQVHLRNLLNKPFLVAPVTSGSFCPADSLDPVLDALQELGAPLERRPAVEASVLEAFAAARPSILAWIEKTVRDPHPRRIVMEGPGSRRVHWLTAFAAPEGKSDLQDVNPEIPAFRHILGFVLDRAFEGEGVKLRKIVEKSPAAAAGLRAGDVILEIGGEPLRNFGDLRRALDRYPFGAGFRLRVRRGKETVEVEGKLDGRKSGPAFHRWKPYWSAEATVEGNRFHVTSSGVARLLIHLSPRLADLEKPVEVRVNGRTLFKAVVEPDPASMLQYALIDRDRSMVYRATIDVPATLEEAAGRLLKRSPSEEVADEVATLIALIRSGDPAADAGPVYEALFSKRLAPLVKAPAVLAGKLLLAEPETPSAWHVLSRVRAIALERAEDPVARVTLLKEWAGKLRSEEKIGAETKLALMLLEARLLLDEGEQDRARATAKDVLASAGASPRLMAAARELARRTKVAPIFAAAPDLRLPGLVPDREITLDDLRGRASLVLLDVGDEEGARLRDVAKALRKKLASYELVVLDVLVGEKARVSRPAGQEWLLAAPGDVASKVAADLGVEGFSAAFLLSPGCRVLENSGWELEGAVERAVRVARRAIGKPLPVLLAETGSGGGWSRFRRVWRALAAGERHLVTAREAVGKSKRAVFALMLAAAARGVRIRGDLPDPPANLHGRLVHAWCDAVLDGKPERLSELLEPLVKARGNECLAVVDAVFDLGLDRRVVREPLERVVRKSRDWRIVSMALRALAHQDTDSEPRELLRLAKSAYWQVRLALAEALEGYRHPNAVDALIDLLGDKSLRVRIGATASLASLTGRDFGPSQKNWVDWRKGDGKVLRLLPRRPDAEITRVDRESEYAKNSYFGLKIASNRLAFVLDKSESMYYGLFDRVVEEVRIFLESAGPTTAFTVVEFAEKPKLWSKGLKPANAMSVKDVVAHMKRGKPYGPTNIMDSLDLAMGLRRVDTVVLLSDGLPNRGARTKPNEILRAVTAGNRYTRVAIHTIWMVRGRGFPHDMRGKEKPPLEDEEVARRNKIRETVGKRRLARFLMSLAARNEGTFGVAFADWYHLPPGARTRPGTDK